MQQEFDSAELRDAEVARLLKAHPRLTVTDDGFKIQLPQCGGFILYSDLNGLRRYLLGKKYKNLIYVANYDYTKYHPHVVTKTLDGIDFLHCNLTNEDFARLPNILEQHVTSGQYLE